MTKPNCGLVSSNLGTIALILISVFPIYAHAFDVLSFAQFVVLPCIHPTANTKTASAEIDKPAVVTGDLVVTRMRVFFDGWVRKNSALFDVQYRPGNSPLVRIKVLEDSSMTGPSSSCKYSTGWQDAD